MKLFFTILLAYFFIAAQPVFCQPAPLDKQHFFSDDAVLNVTAEAYWSRLINQKYKTGRIFPAQFKCILYDSINVDEPVNISVRGNFRRDYCYLPPLKLGFKKSASSIMHPLKSIKLVNACKLTVAHEQYLLKEFVTYRIYNLLTEKSFRVKLLNVNFKDSSQKKSSFTAPAFLLEDLKELGERNNCKEWTGAKILTELTNRNQMTLVALFQFMIGNTDWSVPHHHNIKFIQSKEDSNSKPYAIPYDFDYAGLINTDYAIPDPLLNTETVRQRVYRGFPRTMEELNDVLGLLKQQKEKIYALINNFDLLTSSSKKNMTNYLEEFYDLIKKPRDVKSIFIDNARTE